jgi:vacuolar-type H+-ATPase subunit H
VTKEDKGHGPASNYQTYTESEESLLEQIRSKEDELSGKVAEAEQECSVALEAVRKEADDILARYRHEAEAEADAIWQQAMEKAKIEVEKIRDEGEKKLAMDRERKLKNFSAVVATVVSAVRNG